MKVIVVASHKGGAGKTTLAANLSVAADIAGIGPVAIVDMDPQGTLTRWWQTRKGETPALARMTIANLADTLHQIRESFGLCIIDTPPAITDSIRAVIKVADLVVRPVRPSPADLWAVGGTIDLSKQTDRRFVFVVSQAAPRAGLTDQALAALAVHGAVAPRPVHSRVIFATTMARGLTVFETPNDRYGRAGDEVDAALTFIRKAMVPAAVKAEAA